ncbi:MAG: hypothetical protein MJ162_05185, partial [Treponema sp.]|nr:hypothetical protein [Treponema sp.]
GKVYLACETTLDTYTDRRFYNVMTGGRIEASAVTLNEDKLPVVTKEISEVEGDHYSFTVGELNEHIRIGGLVIIGNVYKTISAIDVSNKKITVSEKIESAWPNGKQNAQFVYAFVVDHTGESTDSDGNVKYDDGDGIVESLTKSANEYTWDASFDSHNIPDGPLTINVVVFDVAGNSRLGSVVTRITNNPPRITSVMLGTDLNRNDSIEDREYTKFYAYKGSHGETDTTRGKEIWNLVPSDETESKDRAWVIKNGLNLIPEFVGGKAPFYYVFSKASGTGSENYLGTPAAGTNLASETTNTGDQGRFAYKSDKSDKAVELTNTNIGTENDDSINTYRFTFWDSTEESTVGVNTGWCILNVELKQDLEDSIKPVAHVHPFFWKGKGDGNNSVSWNGKTPNGHIELERDLTTGENGITGTTVNETALGTDPKVSGTIVIRGTAYDDTKLSKVIVTYDGIIDGTTNKGEASYNGSTWTDNSTANKGYSLSVTDLNGGVTQRGHLVEWALTIDTSKILGQTGLDKKVSVTAVAAYGGASYNTSTVINSTSGVTGIATFYATADQAALGKYYAAEDKALSHKADYKTSTEDNQTEIFDRVVELVGVKTAATSSNPAVNEYKVYGTNSQYQMDIVPYVTEVVTNLSSGKVTNPSVYNRTANGHYPVQSVVKNVESGKMTNTASEDIVLRGFNLGGTVSVAAASTTNNTALSGSAIETATGSKNKDELCFNASTLKSGRPVITVNSIPLMNNLNSNSARGECTADTDEKDYDNCYNRTPNYENNNLLTDDIEFDVWEFNDTIMKAPDKRVMAGFAMSINQNTKMVQYAFAAQRYYYATGGAGNSTYYRDLRGDYVVPSSIGFHVNETGTKWYSTMLDGDDITNYRIYIDGNGADCVAVRGVTAGIKDMVKSPAFTSRTLADGNVRTYHAYYHKGNKKIYFRTNDQLTGTNAQVIAGPNQTGRGAGEYVSIAVTPNLTTNTNDTVCAVWYNQSANKLQYSYKDNNASTAQTDDQASPTGWSTTVRDIFTGGGQHCQIVADANGGIHIAAYVNGSLKYAYAQNYSSAFTTCTVDSGNTGNNLTLDVALVNVASSGTAVYRPVPVIGYYSGVAQKPKYAKFIVSESAFTPSDGMTSGKFTGNWEINYVPVLKNIGLDEEAKICVGLWKQSGNLATSATYSSGTTLRNSTYTLTAANNVGCQTYGNGSSNAILCYLTIEGTSIQSAQMR